ncbi:hypothetical protein [Paenibacillus sp. FSL H7-0331]|uniref:hypothetical protein n=1 Tax=Paenibacillus sp. FSL H7-0331 TaxID=1920421 RepID=UPI00096CEF62|nr:hypothetical protein [Paenibacillus sp. FSL H7-0331]OME93333.1 hypothetical protein BK127_41855 [Paenibacillus sp. FSL H7-0331]
MEWIKVGESEPKVNIRHLITDGSNVGFGYYTFDGEEFKWFPDDNCNVDGDEVTHYAEIELP